MDVLSVEVVSRLAELAAMILTPLETTGCMVRPPVMRPVTAEWLLRRVWNEN